MSEADKRSKVRTCLWYDSEALPASELYVSLMPGSQIDSVSYYPDENGETSEKVMLVEFNLSGVPYQALNGGDIFKLSESVSISVTTEDQAETDKLWESLTSDGGSESQCGWLKDRYGLSWQIIPKRMIELLGGPDAKKVWPALMQMKKINVVALEKAANS